MQNVLLEAQELIKSRNYQEAINILQTIKPVNEEQKNYINELLSIAYTRISDLCYGNKDYHAAFRASAKAAEINPNNWEALVNIGVFYIIKGRYRNAEEWLARSLQIHKSSLAYANLSACLIYQKRFKDALRCARKAIWRNPLNAEAYQNMGFIYLNMHDLNKAEKYFEKAVKVNRYYALSKKLVMYLTRIEGRKMIEKMVAGGTATAVLAGALIGLEPTILQSVDAFYNKGFTHEFYMASPYQPKWGMAMAGGNGSVDYEALARQADQMSPSKNPDKVIELLGPYINNVNNRSSEFYNNLGLAFKQKGISTKAIEYYNKAIQIDVNNFSAHYNLGVLLFNEGRLPEAYSHFSISARGRPNHEGSIKWKNHLEQKLGIK